MNVYFGTLGCRLNEAEIAQWRRGFADKGHTVVENSETADVVVVNTCAVTQEAARKSRKLVGRLHRKNPQARMVVTGCYAALEPARVADLMGVDLVIPNHQKNRLVETLAAEPATAPTQAQAPGATLLPEQRTRAFLKVQDGCRNKCTFCIVTIARGEEVSRSVGSLVEEVQLMAASGHREVVLTGVHLGGYGADIGTDLCQLVETLLAHTDVERIRLSSLEPWDLPDDFAKLWANPRLMPHLHLPLQSGCDRTLKRMARRCPTTKYRDLVRDLRANIPDLVLTTDLIVGFPGETEEDHRQSLAFVREIGFAHVHVFPYSPREGTAAASFSGHLTNDVKKQRAKEAIELADAMRRETQGRFAGQTRPVLWEGGDEQPDGTWRFWGFTDNYLRVETTSARPIHNQVTQTQLSICDDAFSGQVVDA